MDEGEYDAEAFAMQMALHDPPDHPWFQIDDWDDYLRVQSMIGEAELDSEGAP